MTEVTDQQLTYWESIRTVQITTGQATGHIQATISTGDLVQVCSRSYPVSRANKKTVTLPSALGPWTDTTPYHEITDHRAGSTAIAPENNCG